MGAACGGSLAGYQAERGKRYVKVSLKHKTRQKRCSNVSLLQPLGIFSAIGGVPAVLLTSAGLRGASIRGWLAAGLVRYCILYVESDKATA